MKLIISLFIFFNINLSIADTFNIKIGEIDLPKGFVSVSNQDNGEFAMYGFSHDTGSEINTGLFIGIYDYSQNKPFIEFKDIKNATPNYLDDSLLSFKNQNKNMKSTPYKDITISGGHALETRITGVINTIDYSGKLAVIIWNNYVISFTIATSKNNISILDQLSNSVYKTRFFEKQKTDVKTTKPLWKILLNK